MGSSQGVINREGQSQTQPSANGVNEDQYWYDFFRGRSMKKYGDTVVTTWQVDQFVASDLFIGTY